MKLTLKPILITFGLFMIAPWLYGMAVENTLIMFTSFTRTQAQTLSFVMLFAAWLSIMANTVEMG